MFLKRKGNGRLEKLQADRDFLQLGEDMDWTEGIGMYRGSTSSARLSHFVGHLRGEMLFEIGTGQGNGRHLLSPKLANMKLVSSVKWCGHWVSSPRQ